VFATENAHVKLFIVGLAVGIGDGNIVGIDDGLIVGDTEGLCVC
jgi:hypothetical protein